MKKMYAALILSMAVLLSACGGTGAGGESSDAAPVENTVEDQGEPGDVQDEEELSNAASGEDGAGEAGADGDSAAGDDIEDQADASGSGTEEILGTYYYIAYDEDEDGNLDGQYEAEEIEELEALPKMILSKSGGQYVMKITDMVPGLQEAMGLSEAECEFTVDGDGMKDVLVIPDGNIISENYFEDVEIGGQAFRMHAQRMINQQSELEFIQLMFAPKESKVVQYFCKYFDEDKLLEVISGQ